MITFLKGILTDALPTQAVVDVNGVGYEILIPLSSFEKLPELGQAVRLKTQLVVREDSQTLYGFATDGERDLFRLIQSVSGIGPRLALNVLSGMDVGAFKGAIAAADVKRLSSINGVGKKTAERMVLELKDKLGVAGGAATALGQAAATRDKTIADAAAALEFLLAHAAELRLDPHRMTVEATSAGGDPASYLLWVYRQWHAAR